MIGAIAGDIVGSIYEFDNIKTKDFPLFSDTCHFTDDSVLTVALAEAILADEDYSDRMRAWFRRYPNAGYGNSFYLWAESDSTEPYGSFGNGAAMRISPAGFAFDTLEEVLDRARGYTATTHNHPEGIKGGQATASAIFLGRTGSSKTEIKTYIESTFGYNLSQQLASIRPYYRYNETSQDTVPQAIMAFLESTDYEDAIRNAISLGGDSDTLACITGGIAEAFYGGVPTYIEERVMSTLDEEMAEITRRFRERFITSRDRST